MNSPAPAVSVIIVLYNSGATIGRCLAALKLQTFRDYELVLIDNASPQRETDGIEIPEGARIVRNPTNLGFAAANNRAAESCRTRWLALLNPDAAPEPDWLEQLVAAAGRHEAAAYGSVQLKDEAPHLLDGAGDVCHVSGLAWRGLFGQDVSLAPTEDMEVFGPCAAAALYDREAFLAVGGFYERFFCYYEDVDLAFRLRLAGHRSILAPAARIRHIGSASSGGRHSDFAVFHGFRNTIWAFAKNMPLWAMPYALPMHAAMVISLLCLNASRPSLPPALRGLRAALAGLGPVLKDRKALHRTTARNPDMFICWDPFAPLRRPAKLRPLAADGNGTRRPGQSVPGDS